MKTLEQLQTLLAETGQLQRIVLFDTESGARHLSAVLLRVPPAHEFPLHTHPESEDCFFAGSTGMLEVGFQSPANHTAVPFEGSRDASFASSLITRSLPSTMSPLASHGRWTSVFSQRRTWHWLDAEYSVLRPSQAVPFGSQDFESAIVVASGAIAFTHSRSRSLPAFSVIHLDPGSSLLLEATAPGTLLIGVKAHGAAQRGAEIDRATGVPLAAR